MSTADPLLSPTKQHYASEIQKVLMDIERDRIEMQKRELEQLRRDGQRLKEQGQLERMKQDQYQTIGFQPQTPSANTQEYVFQPLQPPQSNTAFRPLQSHTTSSSDIGFQPNSARGEFNQQGGGVVEPEFGKCASACTTSRKASTLGATSYSWCELKPKLLSQSDEAAFNRAYQHGVGVMTPSGRRKIKKYHGTSGETAKYFRECEPSNDEFLSRNGESMATFPPTSNTANLAWKTAKVVGATALAGAALWGAHNQMESSGGYDAVSTSFNKYKKQITDVTDGWFDPAETSNQDTVVAPTVPPTVPPTDTPPITPNLPNSTGDNTEHQEDASMLNWIGDAASRGASSFGDFASRGASALGDAFTAMNPFNERQVSNEERLKRYKQGLPPHRTEL